MSCSPPVGLRVGCVPENASKIIERLFNGYYDLDQAVDATHWCEEGFRRFPENGLFTICQIYIMTMRARTPTPPRPGSWPTAMP
jgi:hypothetical protein